MLVYLDESYRSKERLYLGALFLPTEEKRCLMHKEFTQIKQKEDFIDLGGAVKEIKYTKITSEQTLKIAQEAVKLFARFDNVYFRACTVPYEPDKMAKLGSAKGLPIKIKESIIYTKATTQLLSSNLEDVTNGVLLMDQLTRSQADKFDQLIRYKLANGSNPIFRHIGYVDSKAPSNHLIQICDLLLGAILNETYPTHGLGKFKNEFRKFVKKELKLPSLKEEYWKNKSKKTADQQHPKYNIRFWKTP